MLHCNSIINQCSPVFSDSCCLVLQDDSRRSFLSRGYMLFTSHKTQRCVCVCSQDQPDTQFVLLTWPHHAVKLITLKTVYWLLLSLIPVCDLNRLWIGDGLKVVSCEMFMYFSMVILTPSSMVTNTNKRPFLLNNSHLLEYSEGFVFITFVMNEQKYQFWKSDPPLIVSTIWCKWKRQEHCLDF